MLRMGCVIGSASRSWLTGFGGSRAPGGEGLTTGAAVSAFSLNSPDAGGSRQTSQPLPLTLHGVCNRRETHSPYPGHRSQHPARQRPIPVMPGLPHLHHPWNWVGLAGKAKDTGACCSSVLKAQADRSLGQCQTPRHAFFMASNSRPSGNSDGHIGFVNTAPVSIFTERSS